MSSYVPPTTPIGPPPQGPYGPPPGYPGQPPPQKSKTWIWILGGCGALIVIGIIAAAIIAYYAYRKTTEFVEDFEKNPGMAVARMVIAANPDVELVSIDEDRGVIVVKDKKTGKQLTVDLEDAKNGNIVLQEEGKEAVSIRTRESGSLEMKSSEGTVKFGAGADADKMPDWLPSYPGVTPEGTYSMQGDKGSAGVFTFATSDPAKEVLDYYEGQLKASGLKVNVTSWKQGGAVAGGVIVGEDKASNRTAGVTVGTNENDKVTQVTVTFSTKE
jgi:hypothetical protein